MDLSYIPEPGALAPGGPTMPDSPDARFVATPPPYDFDGSVRFLAFGLYDPTCRRAPGRLAKAVRTPAGPAALHLARSEDGVTARAYGPGASWALERVAPLLGLEDTPGSFGPPPGRVGTWLRRGRGVHLPRSPWVFDRLAQVILQQRVAFRDAARAHRRLVAALREPAPGPPGLLLPLGPREWLALSAEDFRRAGVDGQRASRLRSAARAARSIDGAFACGRSAARARLAAVPGCGPWTVEMTMGFALGDPDAVPIGDLHLPHLVARLLAGEERGDDRRMLELLEPFRGHRFRLVRGLLVGGAVRER